MKQLQNLVHSNNIFILIDIHLSFLLLSQSFSWDASLCEYWSKFTSLTPSSNTMDFLCVSNEYGYKFIFPNQMWNKFIFLSKDFQSSSLYDIINHNLHR